MSKRFASVVAVVLMGVVTPAMAQQPKLNLGDPAPKLEVGEFVKGEPVKSLEKGRIYVVEFWATWCPPCLASIPHLTELQKKYKDVKFVSVSVDQDRAAVKPFVQKMGEKMEYTVAIDTVPAGEQPGKMAVNWMEAAGEDGIPAAFIIDKTGKLAWIGRPLEMDKALEQVVAGSFDIKAAFAERKAAKAEEEKLQEIQKKLAQESAKGGKALLKALDEIIAENPTLEDKLGAMKLTALLSKDGDSEKAAAYGTKLVQGLYKNNPDTLNLVAWAIIDPDAGARSEKLIKLALVAAARSEEIAPGKNPDASEALAKAFQTRGGKTILKPIDDLIAENPAIENKIGTLKFAAILSKDGDNEKAVEYGTKLVQGLYKNNAEALNYVAWTIVDPEAGKRSEKLVKLALMAATRADGIESGKNSQVADTLAKAYFDSGNVAKALESQERAIKLLDKDEEPAIVAELKARLEQYRKAAKK